MCSVFPFNEHQLILITFLFKCKVLLFFIIQHCSLLVCTWKMKNLHCINEELLYFQKDLKYNDVSSGLIVCFFNDFFN